MGRIAREDVLESLQPRGVGGAYRLMRFYGDTTGMVWNKKAAGGTGDNDSSVSVFSNAIGPSSNYSSRFHTFSATLSNH